MMTNDINFDEKVNNAFTVDDIDVDEVKYFIEKSGLDEIDSSDFLKNKVKVIDPHGDGILNAGILFFW
ncbi:MAG: hypothetical protein LBT66_00185 [Methanobrevibacter sp.]|jgi:predicted HTH transcriptional regulator|nr:hypothetical protein [Candidatus Methanovirga meridionalis]